MDDTPAKETPGEKINKLDLSALEAFQFGTQWTDAGGAKPSGGASGAAARERRGEQGPAVRRDRRPPNRPSTRERGDGLPGGERDASRPAPRDEHGPRRDFDRGGGPRPRFERERGRDEGHRRPAGPPPPYVSPVFEVTFYPDELGFNALVKAMRASCRTYELFEIARLILAKPERCVVVFNRRPDAGGVKPPLFTSLPHGVPFPTEDEAVAHALAGGLDPFFTSEVVEVEPPKGAFQFVNRCPVTRELLGPPNHHRYAQTLQHHHASRGIQMPFERYKASIEVVRDPEVVAQWLESMKKATRYTFKGETTETRTVFDTVEEARAFLLRVCRDQVVKSVESARLAAKVVLEAGDSEALEAMNGAVELQRRFPLDTANALRGRLRRENFHIFKRGSKGVTYVCSVRRKTRRPDQVFSESINRLIAFLEANPLIPVAELAPKLLGLTPPPAAPAAPAGEGETAVEDPMPAEERAALNRLALDLRWLLAEGYVAEFSDGRLVVHPVAEPGRPERDHDEGAPEAPEPGAAPSTPEAQAEQ